MDGQNDAPNLGKLLAGFFSTCWSLGERKLTGEGDSPGAQVAQHPQLPGRVSVAS